MPDGSVIVPIAPPVAPPTETFFDQGFENRLQSVLEGKGFDPNNPPGPEPKPEPSKDPEPAKTPAKTPEPEEKAPDSPEGWKKLRTAHKEASEKVKNLEAQIAQLKTASTPTDKTELETLRKQRQELDDTLKSIAVERHPSFAQKYGDAEKAALDLAKKAVSGDMQAQLLQLMQAPDSDLRTTQLEELIKDMSPLRQRRVLDAVAAYDQVNFNKTREIEQSRANWRQMLERQEADQKARVKAEEDKFEALLTKAKAELEPFKRQDGKDDVNREVEERVETVKAFFKAGDAETRAKAAILAGMTPYMAQQIVTLTGQLQTALNQLETFKKGSPQVKLEGTPSPAGDEITDLAEHLAKMAKESGFVK